MNIDSNTNNNKNVPIFYRVKKCTKVYEKEHPVDFLMDNGDIRNMKYISIENTFINSAVYIIFN